MTIRPPPPPPPKDVFFDFASKKQELKAIEPEELTELLDDDLEQWAAGGTRILPPSMKQPPVSTQVSSQQQSFPPVAYASVPPPGMSPGMSGARPSSNAAVWAAVIGMTSVFGIAAILGGVFLFRSHDEANETSTTQATEAVQTTDTHVAPPPVVTTDEQTQVAPLATVAAAPVVTSHATTIATTNVATNAAKPPVVVIGSGTLQTFAVSSGKPVFVDGKQVGVGGTHIKTTCGKHSISVGSGRARSVDVPCSGTITVGTPDGT